MLRQDPLPAEPHSEQPIRLFGVSREIADDYRTVVLAVFKAAEFEDPQATMQRVYEQALPTQEEFRRWVLEVVEPSYLEAMRKVTYLSVVKVLAHDDDDLYMRLHDHAFREEERRHVGGKLYSSLAENIPPFKPVSVREYCSRFIEYPEHIHERALYLAQSWALERHRKNFY